MFPEHLGASVHWGAVGEFSGAQTPAESPAERPTVIASAPPALPPRGALASSHPQSLPPRPAARQAAGQGFISPTLLGNISAVLQQLPAGAKEPCSQETPVITKNTGVRVPKRLSSTTPFLLESSKIPIVSTSESSFESFPEVFTDQTMASQEQQDARVLLGMRRLLVREMDEFAEDDVCSSRLPVLERDLSEIKRLKNEYQDHVEDYIENYKDEIDDEEGLERWKRDVQEVGKMVKNHARKIRDKKESLFPTPVLEHHEQRKLELQEQAVKFQELTLQEKQRKHTTQQQEKNREAEVLEETEANLFLGECSVLGDMIPDEAWDQAEDNEVAEAVRNLPKYEEQWAKIERAYRKYENSALKYNFGETAKAAIKATYEDRKERYETTRDDLKREDADRGLFTLEPARTDIIKYPTFSGAPHEDYLKFKETMEQRFRENKVRKKEQAAKLRESLKGAALARVPDGIKDIEEAFKRLGEAFGNPAKIMNFHLKALEDLGTLPPERLPGGQLNFARRIEWLLKLEVILGKILELSTRSSKLAHEAFSSTTYRKLWARFPTNILDKLVKIPGEDSERMKGVLDKIVKIREHSQVMDDECGSTATAVGGKKQEVPPKVTAELFFSPPQTYQDCRLCVHLSATDPSQQGLFVNHLSNYVTGCPKFIQASTENRKVLATKIKLCRQCFHPDIIFTRDHLAKCPFSKKKNSYSCRNSNCKDHMWICLPHKQENRQAMDKFKRDLLKQGHTLAYTGDIPILSNLASPQLLHKAVRKIKRVEKKKGAEIVPVPEGQPMFLFHPTQGRTEAVYTFYDSGCSHAVFQEGIPGAQLRGQIVSKGPFTIDGVGGLVTAANDEWVVSVPRADGKKQLIQGLTVPRITSDFPYINLEAAIKDVKDDDPTNTLLQNCRAPPMAGGCVQMLLGIKYVSIFPKEIHTLSNGLTIYESRLASHNGKYNSCIGGPHSSFTALAGEMGGTARLLLNFIDGLQTFRKWGPPRLHTVSMTDEEVELAKQYNANEGEMKELADYLELENSEVDNNLSCCSHCPADTAVYVASDERVREFKKHQDIHESGLEVLYRCPKCRNCADCKAADKTEKISLREESEMHEISKSVHLDFENKRILCSLPTRGSERDFLSSNRDRAEKVLRQQIKKYSGDSETKQTILEAFQKLFSNGHAKLLDELDDEDKEFLMKEVQHHLVWRVVFSGSVTTPTRPVMDASARTAFRRDGTGGRSLNDLVCKGKIESLNMIKVLLRFIVGRAAFTGDLKQFYNSCKLDSSQWNLQRFLWVKDLDPKGEILEAVITTLIYGVSSVSAQTEFAMAELASYIQHDNPELALFLVLSRYVDDLQDSKSSLQSCLKLAQDADQVFALLGLQCKAWTYTGLPPSPTVSKDELSINIFGVFSWFSEGDILELKLPQLHFGKPRRGRIPLTVKFFEGSSVEDMEKFVPDPLTKRQAASKVASIWDLLGHLTPIMPQLKIDLRQTFQQTEGWDTAIPSDLRQKWVQNFWLLERLRGLKFVRAVMPPEAANTEMRLLTLVDAAKPALVMGSWGGFKLRDGSWSNQLVLGRCLLSKNESIPKSELDALCGGSNMAWVIRLALKEWVHSDYLFSDSMIALCWLTSEKLRLELFHRNRVLQIRRGTDLHKVYHVKTDANPADCGTRPEKVKVEDIGPHSRWECGDMWMKMDIPEAVKQGYIKPVSEIRITKDIEDEVKEGLMFSDKDDAVLRGQVSHTVHSVTESRVQKIQDRATFSDYLILPTKFSFPSLVRIYGYVLTFAGKARKGRKMLGHLLRESRMWFSVFPSNMTSPESNLVKVVEGSTSMPGQTQVLQHFSLRKLVLAGSQDQNRQEYILSNHCLHQALLYLFRKGALEVKKFVSKKVVSKIAQEVDGILISKGRMLDGMNFVNTGELGEFNIETLGVKIKIPVLERFSPLSYAIAQHVHWKIGRHRGIETTHRLTLEHVSIIQGMTLCRELAEECIKCHMKRKKFVEVPMGPIAQEQLMIAHPFHVTMIDLCGPMKSYVPSYERETRNRPALHSQVYIMVSVCITTKIINLQALEGKTADAIIDGFTRLSAEVGIPTMVHIDQDTGVMAGFQSVELDYKDLQHRLLTQFGISYSTCPVGGHDQHGLVERIIKSVKETFADAGVDKMRIHSLGWQTFCKLAENAYNNIPFGYSYSRGQDNTELLKILTPNMLRVGKINNRALDGPIRLPESKREILANVEKTYQTWFRIFRDTMVPRLINQPKWFKVERDLKEKDLVYFQKEDSPLSKTKPWTIGQVDQVIASRDGHIRRAVIKYYNYGEKNPHFTDRSVRTLVKLWSLDESCLFDDLKELQTRLTRTDRVDAEVCGNLGDGVHGQGDDQLEGDPGLGVPSADGRAHSCSPSLALIAGYSTSALQLDSESSPLDTIDSLHLNSSISCDLSPVLVVNPGHVEESLPGVHGDVAEPPATLHDLLVIQGFTLE